MAKKKINNKMEDSERNAKKFVEILGTADGGCSFCVEDLLKLFIKKFPEHKKIAERKLMLLKLENEI